MICFQVLGLSQGHNSNGKNLREIDSRTVLCLWHCAICAATAFVATCTSSRMHRLTERTVARCRLQAERHRDIAAQLCALADIESLDSLRQRLQRLVERHDGFARTSKHTGRMTNRHPEFSDPEARRLSCTDRTVGTLPCRSAYFSSGCAVDRFLPPSATVPT